MLRVASYNIRKCIGLDRRRDPGRVLGVIGALNADVVALQEVDRRIGARSATLDPGQILARTGLVPVPLGTNGPSMGWHGNALLVRKGAEVRDVARITLPAVEPRGAIRADVSIDGRNLRVVGVHLAFLPATRHAQIETILEHLDTLPEQPTVVMGDFNEWSGTGALAAFGPGYSVWGHGPSFHAAMPIGRLDRIVTSTGLHVAHSGVHRKGAARTASDHLPVWADLRPADLHSLQGDRVERSEPPQSQRS